MNFIVTNPIIMILKAILNYFRLRRNYIANGIDKIPPELKKVLVAWYSPKKQKLNNYDVIESYAEDFTRLNYYEHRGTINRTSNKIVITESKTNILNIIENINASTNDIVIKVTGVSEELKLFVQDINSVRQYISKDGVYKFTNNVYQFFGFGINKIISGINVVIEQLPTSILKDFSGNGNHAYLYGGKGKLNSGMGVYQQDFSKLIISRVDKKQDSFSFTVSGSGGSYLAYMQLGNWNNKAFKISANINAKGDYLYLRFRNSTDAVITSVMLKNGENIIPAQNIESATKAVFEYSLKEGESITITQIPDYPDQLCYDGKMYAVAYDMPILTDYTVIADRTWFAEKVDNGVFMSKALEQNGAFILEYKQGDKWNTYSYYSATNINIDKDNSIVYQTKNKYNEQTIYPGDKQDTDTLFIGTIRKDDSRSFIGCHGDILLFNRTLTDNELDLVKEHFFGIIRIKDALLTVDGKPIITTDNKYIKVNKK